MRVRILRRITISETIALIKVERGIVVPQTKLNAGSRVGVVRLTARRAL